MASTTSNVSCVPTLSRIRRSSAMSSVSTWRRPAVSRITTLLPRRSASLSAPFATLTGSVGSENTGTSMRSPRTRSCSTAAGRWRSAATSGGGLPRALEAGQHHDRRRLGADRELARLAPEGRDELLVHDLDDLLCRAEALRDLGAAGALLHPVDERLDDRDVHVGLEQGDADLACDLVDVLVAQPTAAAQALEDAVEPVGEGVKHASKL